MSASAELYQAVIDEHRRRPRNRGVPPAANRVARRENPSCGDVCAIHLALDEDGSGRVVDLGFTGAGCALSQASASLATVALAGRGADEARQLIDAVECLVRTGDATALPAFAPADVAALSAAHAFPARHACALLAWQAARDALATGPA